MNLIKRRSGILAIAVLVACGGSGLRATSRDAAQGGGGVSTGGAGGIAGTGGIFINLSGVSPQGGAPSQGGSSGEHRDATIVDVGIMICGCGFSFDPPCDQETLWYELVILSVPHAPGGYCMATQDPILDGGDALGGYIVFDSDGRVVDNTAYGPYELQSKQAWLDFMAGYRWPCLAGQTIRFTCDRGGD